MNYKFLASKTIEKYFEETGLTVGEIMRAMMTESISGIKVENKARFTELTEKEWYNILTKTFENEQE
jgi:hypothetical protein